MWKKLEFNRNEIAASSQIEIHFRKLDKYKTNLNFVLLDLAEEIEKQILIRCKLQKLSRVKIPPISTEKE